MTETVLKILFIVLICTQISARIHRLKVENDLRTKIDLTTFGFLKGGKLAINLTNFHFELEHFYANTQATTENSFGFSLGKTSNDNLQEREETCLIRKYKEEEEEDKSHKDEKSDKGLALILFTLDLKSDPPCICLTRIGEDLKYLNISLPSEDTSQTHTNTSSQTRRKRRSLDFLSDSFLFPQVRSRREAADDGPETSGAGGSGVFTTTAIGDLLPLTTTPLQQKQEDSKDEKKDNPVESDNETKVQSTLKPGSDGQLLTTTIIPPENNPIAPAVPENDSATGNETKVPSSPQAPGGGQLVTTTIPLKRDPLTGRYSTYFVVDIITDQEEGLYNLFFHNCDNYFTVKDNQHKSVNFTVRLAESNYHGKNYLSAGEIPLPSIYMGLCGLYFVLAGIWWIIIRRATDGVFKTHYMMLVFLFVKCISLFFHSINFHFIQTEGHHEAAFAILYYITYLMKGTLLFVTIVLVGAGWAFVKHILSKRDKKIFIIVIPLQILANVAQIIIEETEEGQSQYLVWKQLFIMLDLLCCGAILFPVIWSIRHLQDASQTDGKAAINLLKLKIFRHFYIMIVCYIYFTRIIVYLLAMTLPFQYTWMCTIFKETAALVFFVVTGVKFRPASDNPYLQLPQSDDEDVEMDQVLTESGVTEGLTRVNIKDPSNSTGMSTKQRESSHEYD